MFVHSVFFHFLHAIFALWIWLQHVIASFLLQFSAVNLQKHVQNIKKLPIHVAFVLEHDPPYSYTQLASIVVWCSTMGIPYISFYDHDGLIKCEESKLSSIISMKYEQLMGTEDIPTFNFKSHSNGVTNGTKRKVCKINLLSHLDGMRNVALLARDSAAMQHINLQLLDNKLRGDSASSPDLLICCGNSVSTIGFLPWHLHLTEIMYIRDHRTLTYDMFVQLLTRFGQCEQRCGK